MAKELIPSIQDMMDRQRTRLAKALDRKLLMTKLQLALWVLTVTGAFAFFRPFIG